MASGNELREFLDPIYAQDVPKSESSAWIQWKGTDVCMDIHCRCGHMSHFDGDFAYIVECPHCHQAYAMGCNVKMIPLTDEQREWSAENWFDPKQAES